MKNLSGLRRTLLLLFAFALVLSITADRGVQRATAAPPSFSFNWNGTPVGPMPWSPALINDWDLIVHNRDHQDYLQVVNAEHGANCAAFPATHPVIQLQDAVFICNNHMMTALNGGGYSEIVMTPARLLDFSAGGTVQVSISTAKLDNRDWLDFWISPFSENLLLPSGGIPPDLQGPTKDALLVGVDAGIPTDVGAAVFHNYVGTEYSGTGRSIESCVAPLGGVSTSRRDPFLLTLSRTHVRVDVLVNGAPCTLLDTNIADLGFTLGVVQIGHHSYAPDEGTMCNLPGCTVNTGVGAGNTWHWSNFSMSPAVPFTMLRGDMSMVGVQATTSRTVHFAGAAPANSFLRFSGHAKRHSIQVSANGGPFFPAQEQLQNGDGKDGVVDGSHIGYWTPIPAGTTNVTFMAQDSSQPWTIQDVAIWSSDQASITPIAVPPGGGGGSSGGGNVGGGGGVVVGETEGQPGAGGNPLEGGPSGTGADEHPRTGGGDPTEHPMTGGGGSAGQPTSAGGEPAEQPSNKSASPQEVRSNGAGPGTAAIAVRDEVTAMVQKQGALSALRWVGLLVGLLGFVAVLGFVLRRRLMLSRRADRRRYKK